MELGELGSHAVNLRGSRLSRIFHRMDPHLVNGDRRTVFPDLIQRIEIGPDRDTSLAAQLTDQRLHRRHVITPPVDADLRVLVLELCAQPLSDGRGSFDLLFHKLKGGARQLVFRSEEVTAVGPQGGGLHRHHGRACRAREPTDPFSAFPTVRGILRMMRVSRGKNKCVELFAAHHLAQIGKARENRIVYHRPISLLFRKDRHL